MAEDWVTLHLQWIKRNKDFLPREQNWLTDDVTYYERMSMLYQCQKHHPHINKYARQSLALDVDWFQKSKKILFDIYRLNETPTQHFITIGFNHQTWSIDKCVSLINLILGFDWIDTGKAVFELHRENGEHPHCHFLIQSSLSKSKILEKIWAAKGIKKIVLQKSFIDYKVALPVHDRYVEGDKTEAKLPFCKKDAEWRTKNNIKHLFEK